MLHHLGLRLGVECRGALVHQYDGGFLGQGCGYLDALPLSAAEVLAALCDGALIGTRALHDLLVYLRVVAGQYHGEVFYRLVPHLHVVGNRPLEERHVLVDHRDGVDEGHAVDSLARLAVEEHLALPGLIEARHEAQYGALAASRRSDQGDALARLDLHREVTDDRGQRTVVTEGDVTQLYLARQLGHIGQLIAFRQAQVCALLATVGHILDALDRRVKSHKGLYAGYGSVDGIDGLVDQSLRGQQHAGCQFALQNQPCAQA